MCENTWFYIWQLEISQARSFIKIFSDWCLGVLQMKAEKFPICKSQVHLPNSRPWNYFPHVKLPKRLLGAALRHVNLVCGIKSNLSPVIEIRVFCSLNELQKYVIYILEKNCVNLYFFFCSINQKRDLLKMHINSPIRLSFVRHTRWSLHELA